MYNPFNKRLQELVGSDLETFINEKIAEGYWVEYKREFHSES